MASQKIRFIRFTETNKPNGIKFSQENLVMWSIVSTKSIDKHFRMPLTLLTTTELRSPEKIYAQKTKDIRAQIFCIIDIWARPFALQ